MLKNPIDRAMRRLAGADAEFLNRAFVAPAVRGCGVDLKVGDARCTLAVRPADFHGWGYFAPVSHRSAKAVRPATADERVAFLAALPAVRLVICGAGDRYAPGVAANQADGRFGLKGPTLVLLTFNVNLFDIVLARFDGVRYWFDRVDGRYAPSGAVRLRAMLSALVRPEDLPVRSFCDGQREAYRMAYVRVCAQRAKSEK